MPAANSWEEERKAGFRVPKLGIGRKQEEGGEWPYLRRGAAMGEEGVPCLRVYRRGEREAMKNVQEGESEQLCKRAKRTQPRGLLNWVRAAKIEHSN